MYSKHTGIIRRLDKLGRVVIPREFRKLHKIKVTDPLEINCHDNGDIVVRKFDISSELVTAGQPVADELFNTLNHTVLLCAPTKIVHISGSSRVVPVGTRLEAKTTTMIDERKCFTGKAKDIGIDVAEYATMCTIFCEDVFGAFILVSDSPIQELESKTLQMAARILGNSMQKF